MTPASETPERSKNGSVGILRRRLSGDLDGIVLMALRKEPQRRYASVEKFSEDIRRHLEGLPVTSRRDSWRYRAGKFVARHKLGVAATALVLMVVMGGAAATVREARIAASNERRAEQRFNDVRKLANSMMFEIHDAIRDLPGSTSARRLLVTRALEYLDSLSAQSKGDVSLQKELAAAYERVGDVLGYPYAANLGDTSGAERSYRKALAIRETLAHADPNDIKVQQELIGDYFRVAQVLEFSGKFAEALDTLRKALPTAQRIATGSKDPAVADVFAGAYYFMAYMQVQIGDWTAALENYERSASIRDAALQANPGSLPLRTHLAADDAGIAKCLDFKGDVAGAVQMQSKATTILEDIVKSNPRNTTFTEYLGESVNSLATFRKEQGDSAAALESFRRAHEIFAELLKADSKNSLAKSNFGFSDSGIAHTLVALHDPASAVKVFRESIATFEEMSPRTAANHYLRTGLANAYSGLGGAYSILATGRSISLVQKRAYWEEAHSSCQKSLVLWKDKEKRGELESSEREDPSKVMQCVAESEMHVRELVAAQNSQR